MIIVIQYFEKCFDEYFGQCVQKLANVVLCVNTGFKGTEIFFTQKALCQLLYHFHIHHCASHMKFVICIHVVAALLVIFIASHVLMSDTGLLW